MIPLALALGLPSLKVDPYACVYLIESEGRRILYGTGFRCASLDQDGLITSLHCVASGSNPKITVTNRQKIKVTASVYMIDETNDLAVLRSPQLANVLKGAPSLPLSKPLAPDLTVLHTTLFGYGNRYLNTTSYDVDGPIPYLLGNFLAAHGAPKSIVDSLNARNSPKMSSGVLQLHSGMAEGFSGGPIVDEKTYAAIGVASGEALVGQWSWASLLQNKSWERRPEVIGVRLGDLADKPSKAYRCIDKSEELKNVQSCIRSAARAVLRSKGLAAPTGSEWAVRCQLTPRMVEYFAFSGGKEVEEAAVSTFDLYCRRALALLTDWTPSVNYPVFDDYHRAKSFVLRQDKTGVTCTIQLHVLDDKVIDALGNGDFPDVHKFEVTVRIAAR